MLCELLSAWMIDYKRMIYRSVVGLLLLCSMALFSGCGGGGSNGNNSTGGQSGTPAITEAVVTQGSFSSGEQGATYSIQVANTGSGATSGTVTVVDPDTGFTVTGISGTNWSCTVATLTCTYSLSVGAGQSFPPITVSGNVTASNGSAVSISVTASGGGTSAPVSPAPSMVPVAAPVLSIKSTHTGNFIQGEQGATYTLTVTDGTSAGATNGSAVTVNDTLPSGESLVSMAGSGWNCVVATASCTRSDVLPTNTSYPAITVTLNVAANATSPELNNASVSGGGATAANAAPDSTTIYAMLQIGVPTLAAGEVNAAYTSQAFTASGGSGTGYTFGVASGSLSPLAINSSTGIISGTSTTAGTLQFTIKVTDSAGDMTLTAELSISIDAPPTITSFAAGNPYLTGGTSTGLTAVFSGGTGLINNGVGAVSSGTPVAVSPTTNTTYTLTVTNSADVSVTQTVTVDVVAASNTACTSGGFGSGQEALLSGSYVFFLKGFDNGLGTGETQAEPAMVGGVITFNGSPNNGLITSAVFDANFDGTAGVLTLPETGTYIVANQTACLTLNTSQNGQLVTHHYAVSLANINSTTQIAATGHVVNIDTTGPFTQGTLRQQTAIPSSLSGSFAFEADLPLNTAQGGGKTASAGVITFLANGTASGEFDQSNTGQIDGQDLPTTWPSTAAGALTNGSYSFASNGRGMLTITPTGSPAVTFILYAVSDTDLLLMDTQDQTTAGPVGGEAIAQSGTFGSGSLNGTFVSYVSGLNASAATSFAQIGVFTANGTGTITAANLWANNAGTVSSSSAPAGTSYTVGTDGRVLNNSGSGPLYYLVSTNYGFVLGSGTQTATGMIEPQTSTSAPSGTFAIGDIDEQDANVGVQNGVFSVAVPTMSGVINSNGAGSPPALNQAVGPFNFSVDNTGLGSVSNNTTGCTINSGINPCQSIFYVISGNRFVTLEADEARNQPSLTIVDQ